MSGSLERRHRLLDRWSRSVAALMPALETKDFVPALLAAVQRLVHADFIMAIAPGQKALTIPQSGAA
jgi:hypothetical protein